MVLDSETIEQRVKELEQITSELAKYWSVSRDKIESDLSQRWIIERGLIAAASIIFDIADHILVSQFGIYPQSYEESLVGLRDQGVISRELYAQMRGLGGFRNILIHRYLAIDPRQVFEHFHKSLDVFPRFIQAVLDWIDSIESC